MKKIITSVDLKEAILLLETQQAEEAMALKNQCLSFFEQLNPFDLIKNFMVEMVKMPDFKAELVNTAMSIATGYLSKKIVIGDSHNPLKQGLGLVLQLAVSNLVSKNAEGIKNLLSNLVNKLFNKKEEEK
jgi:hypothetical protein